MSRLIAVLVLLLMVAVVIGIAVGAARWRAGTDRLRARLVAARETPRPSRVDFRELDGLPVPVQAYFRTVLEDGQPMLATAALQHRGTFNLRGTPDGWQPFSSDQRVVLRRPGFDWDARINMAPGVTVFVHDAYVAGEGLLQAAVFGLVTVAELRGTTEVAEGELYRFLAESAWYPTALLPSQGAEWRTVDERQADVTLRDGAVAVTLRITFGDDGLIAMVRAEQRGRQVGDTFVPTPWQGRFRNYAVRDGVRVPLDGEVAWVVDGTEQPYWRGHVEAIAFERAE